MAISRTVTDAIARLETYRRSQVLIRRLGPMINAATEGMADEDIAVYQRLATAILGDERKKAKAEEATIATAAHTAAEAALDTTEREEYDRAIAAIYDKSETLDPQ